MLAVEGMWGLCAGGLPGLQYSLGLLKEALGWPCTRGPLFLTPGREAQLGPSRPVKGRACRILPCPGPQTRELRQAASERCRTCEVHAS